MKKTKNLIIALFLIEVGVVAQAQTLDRISLSSGGISSDTLNATLGEIFVFSVSSGGISFDAGSQSDNTNTGGIPIPYSVTQTETTQSAVLVYPNPVGDLLNMQINGLKSETIAFQVYDINGKAVLQQTISNTDKTFKLKVSNLTAGNYFVNGYSAAGEKIRNIKFVKL